VQTIDLVITDILRQEHEGVETIRALRTRHHPATMITVASVGSRALGHLLERSLLVGAERTFQKSILPSPLLTLVQTRLART
jgi:CheY-like chemotaxis protein